MFKGLKCIAFEIQCIDHLELDKLINKGNPVVYSRISDNRKRMIKVRIDKFKQFGGHKASREKIISMYLNQACTQCYQNQAVD